MTSYDYLLCETLGFTASRGMDQVAREGVVTNVLVRIPQMNRYVTGGCRGGDSFLGQWLYAMYPPPYSEHVVIVPANRSQIDPWWLLPGRAVTVIEMPPGTTYADRNAEIVKISDALVGFPSYPKADRRSQRSGSWQTIGMAERAGTLSQWHCVHTSVLGTDRKVPGVPQPHLNLPSLPPYTSEYGGKPQQGLDRTVLTNDFWSLRDRLGWRRGEAGMVPSQSIGHYLGWLYQERLIRPDRHSWVLPPDEIDYRIAEIHARRDNTYLLEEGDLGIPPDELPLLNPDSCADCGMSDGPLYQGRLCRWCWKLASLRAEYDQQKAAESELSVARPAPDVRALVLALLFVLVAFMILGMSYSG